MCGLRCQGEISIANLERRHAIAFGVYFVDDIARLRPLEEDGLVRVEPGHIVATMQGGLMLRNIAMCFDHSLQNPMPAAPTPDVGFSPAI
jgi:oxygen-independent coproporphyrinogen III oxidase